MKTTTHNEFVATVKAKLPNITVVGKYCNMVNRILVVDENGYEYTPIANSLIRGYKPTFKTAVNPTQIFIDRARSVHRDLYDYGNTVYMGHNKKVIITCKEHGDFKQSVKHHYIGSGCPKCIGFSMDAEKWIDKTEGEAKLYVITLASENETFYKVGITKQPMNKRYYPTKLKPYVIVDSVYRSGDARTIYDSESKIKRLLSSYRYVPNIKIDGWSECFTWEGAKIILTLLPHITSPIAR